MSTYKVNEHASRVFLKRQGCKNIHVTLVNETFATVVII